jgi:hypothetical protein
MAIICCSLGSDLPSAIFAADVTALFPACFAHTIQFAFCGRGEKRAVSLFFSRAPRIGDAAATKTPFIYPQTHFLLLGSVLYAPAVSPVPKRPIKNLFGLEESASIWPHQQLAHISCPGTT